MTAFCQAPSNTRKPVLRQAPVSPSSRLSVDRLIAFACVGILLASSLLV
jgi:hypothetical protein